MSFSVSNDYLDGRKPVPSAAGNECIATRFELSLATADLALNKIGAIGILPAGHVPVDILFDSDDLDTNGTPTIAWSIGVGNLANKAADGTASTDAVNTLISTTAADGGAAWGTSITTSQAGGQAQVLSKALSRVQKVEYDRYIVLLATAAAATAAAGKVGATLRYRPA